MANVRSYSVELGRQRLQGSKVPRRGPLFLLTNVTLELLGKFNDPFVHPTSFEGLDHVFGVTMTGSTVKEVEPFPDTLVLFPTLTFPSLGLGGVSFTLGFSRHWESQTLEFISFPFAQMIPTPDSQRP